METNRIDFNLALTNRNTTGKSGGGASGFADLLFGAMSQKADVAAVDKSQIKTTEPYTPRRRFDDYPLNQIDYRDQGDSHVDRRIDNDQSRSRWSTTETGSTNPGRGAQERADREELGGHPAHHAVCGDQPADETDEITDGLATEPAAETDLPEGDQEIALQEDGGTGGDMSDNGSDDADARLLTVMTTPPVEEAAASCDIAIDTVGEAAALTAGIPAVTDDAEISNAADTGDDVAKAAALAAAPALVETPAPEAGVDGGTAPEPEGTEHSETNKAAVTFSSTLADAETDAGATAAQNQASGFAARNERQLEDSGNSFRRNLAASRRAPANGQGAAQAAGNNANPQSASANAEVRATSPSTMNSSSALATGTVPAGFDAGFGNAAGLPGWNLNLAQGAVGRRGDFVANLRQHLQNLPAHEQVALTIQRSVRDGGGSITLQLSPTELGRIHLKLDIDEDKNVQASVTVERPATLELLQRDMKTLERALQEAGLKAGPGDLSFSLQGGDAEAFARDFGSGNGTGSGGGGLGSDNGAEAETSPVPSAVIETADGFVDVQV
ncbi:flagellar hook-length control protein FliK [Dongia sp.]|uniref:flagellar hook-length control protein FliK n=1 Tax=Dongia sp. TaxID=1977262 RepID=UPI0035B43D61